MNRYLDIGVVQIQHWLARTQKLRGRRGASSMIRTATAPDTVAALIERYDGAVQPNSETGPIDGVIHLRVITTDENVIATVERDLLSHLRRKLPMAALRAVETHGPNYAERGDAVARDWLAPVHEWSLARPCEWCRSSPGHQSVAQDAENDTKNDAENTHVLCVDCLERHRNAGTARGRVVSAPERDLLELVGDGRSVPDESTELAALGLGGPDDDTHLATVYADGNALGAFIRDVHRRHPKAMAQLPSKIHTATWAAVRAGLAKIDNGGPTMPIIAHLVGGDDILITVPAHGAWDFADAMTSAFTDALHDAVPQVRDTPTLTSGVVIHHHSFPLSATIDLAGDLLRAAKKAFPGIAALAWQAITHDGPTISGRAAIPHTQLRAHHAHLTALADLPASQRQQLARLGREGRPEDLDRQIERLGLGDVTAPFRTTASDTIPLHDALDMARWWRR
ncbi:Cas10/Cmr2 second palm domain-containing protein [Actinophytocola sp. KF-1]